MGCYGRYLVVTSVCFQISAQAQEEILPAVPIILSGLGSPHSYLIGGGALGSHMWMSNCMILRNSPHHKSLKWTKKTWHWLHYCSFFLISWCEITISLVIPSYFFLLQPPFTPFPKKSQGFSTAKKAQPQALRVGGGDRVGEVRRDDLVKKTQKVLNKLRTESCDVCWCPHAGKGKTSTQKCRDR